jgi:hypothetical protein
VLPQLHLHPSEMTTTSSPLLYDVVTSSEGASPLVTVFIIHRNNSLHVHLCSRSMLDDYLFVFHDSQPRYCAHPIALFKALLKHASYKSSLASATPFNPILIEHKHHPFGKIPPTLFRHRPHYPYGVQVEPHEDIQHV